MPVSARRAPDGRRPRAAAGLPLGRMNRAGRRGATMRPWAVQRRGRSRRDRDADPEQRARRRAGRRRRDGARHLRAVALPPQRARPGAGDRAGHRAALPARGRGAGRAGGARRVSSPAARRPRPLRAHRRDRGRRARPCPSGSPCCGRSRRAPRTRCAGAVRQAAWRLGATGLSGALLGRAAARARRPSTTACGWAGASPPSRSRCRSASASPTCVDRLRAGEHARGAPTARTPPRRRCRPLGVAVGDRRGPGRRRLRRARARRPRRPPAGRGAAGAARRSGGWPGHAGFLAGLGARRRPRSGTGRCGGSRR